MTNQPVDTQTVLPVAAGLGYKRQHHASAMAGGHNVAWFEVHAENYMGAGGPPHAMLTELRARFPLSVHGVGLSIGAEKPLDRDHLARLKAVVDRYEPAMVSEHLAWSTHGDQFLNDLLPAPYTQATLARVADHIAQVQDALGRRILLENPSTYLTFDESDMTELQFLRDVAARTGCGLLLDVNNVFVSATNLGYSPEGYIDRFPMAHVGEIHLGGHAPDADEDGAPLLIDAHDREVTGDVWALYERALSLAGPTPTLIEWDNDVPEWPVLTAEAARANAALARWRPMGKAHDYAAE